MVNQENSRAAVQKLPWAEIIKFYIPLAAAAMIMLGSVNVVNSALSRTPNPQIALAAFAIAYSYAEMVSAPCFSGMNMMITLGRDRVYFLATFKFMLKVTGVAIIVIGLLAFTPIGRFVALYLGGASIDLFNDIQVVWRWALIVPVIFLVMSVSRSVLLTERATSHIAIARTIRLIVMLALASFLPRLNSLSGATIGTLIIICGMGTESLIATIPAIRMFKKWPTEPTADIPKKDYPPTQKAAFKFLSPLMITSLMWGVTKPILFAGLARMNNPELTIATYRVASTFIWLFMGFIEDNVKQVTVAFLRNTANSKIIIKFSVIVSLTVVGIIILTAVTPFGEWVITNVIGVDKTIAMGCLAPILVLSVYPIILTVQEHFQARLLIKGDTKPIGFAKVMNIAAMGITVFAIAVVAPNTGPMAGAIALTAGMAVDALLIRYFALKFRA